jgi:hypothetical protein
MDETEETLYRSAVEEAERRKQAALIKEAQSDEYLGGRLVGAGDDLVGNDVRPPVIADVSTTYQILNLSDADAAAIATNNAAAYAAFMGCPQEDVNAAIQTKPKAVLLGMKSGLRPGMREAPKSSVLFLRSFAKDLTGLALIGKGGKMFKTIRIPKFGLAGVRKKGATSPAMFLLGLARFAWKITGFGGVPPGFFVRVIMAFFRKLGNVDPRMSLGKAQVAAILNGINAAFPALSQNYTAYKTANGAYKDAIETAKVQSKAARQEFYTAMKALNASTASTTIADMLSSLQPIAGGTNINPNILDQYAPTVGTMKNMTSKSNSKKIVKEYEIT